MGEYEWSILSVIPGHSTSSGQCSLLGGKDKSMQTTKNVMITGTSHTMSGSQVRKVL